MRALSFLFISEKSPMLSRLTEEGIPPSAYTAIFIVLEKSFSPQWKSVMTYIKKRFGYSAKRNGMQM
jgi:hypothetical protein